MACPETRQLQEQLRRTVLNQECADFPSWLLPEILALANDASLGEPQALLLEEFIELIEAYDPYAGVGCFASGSSIASIQAALRQLRS